MQILNQDQCTAISAGLTDKQLESLVAKAGGYVTKAVFLSIMVTTTSFVPLHSFLIAGIAAPIASLTGTYLFYENQDYVINLIKENFNMTASPSSNQASK